jgi:pimeloyl-ACP methyl ester carboxylesterase
MATYVFVAGGGYGGFIWKKVASRLRARRHEVFTPTLTGLGERAHLASPQIDLDTHLQDIIGVLEYEDLHDVFLVGHSYGGMVITGVAQQVPQRLARLVYLDALVPQDGQSVLDIIGPFWKTRFEKMTKTQGDGWRLPSLAERSIGATGITVKTTAHPFQSLAQPLALKNPAASSVPHTFIYCTESGWSSEHIAPLAARARAEGWDYYELATAHMAMLTMPKELADILLEIAVGVPVL